MGLVAICLIPDSCTTTRQLNEQFAREHGIEATVNADSLITEVSQNFKIFLRKQNPPGHYILRQFINEVYGKTPSRRQVDAVQIYPENDYAIVAKLLDDAKESGLTYGAAMALYLRAIDAIPKKEFD